MNFDRKELSNIQLLDLYKRLLKPRLIEEKMLILLRQGKVSKWFSGIGFNNLLYKSNNWILDNSFLSKFM